MTAHSEAQMSSREPLQVHATLVTPDDAADSVDLGELLAAAWSHWKLIFGLAFVGAGAAYGASYLAQRMYRAEVVAEAVSLDEVSGGLSALGSRFGGVANLLGVDIGGSGTSTASSIAVLKSRRLIGDFITRNQLLPVLYADKWDPVARRWRVGEGRVPTAEDAFRKFSKKLLAVREDKKDGLITIAIEWNDPRSAARWANELVRDANLAIASQAQADADRNVEFLNAELLKTDDIGLRQAIFSLVESEVKKRMLARTRVDYAFRVLDPAVAPDAKRFVSPQRILWALGGGTGGLFLAALIVLVRNPKRDVAADGAR